MLLMCNRPFTADSLISIVPDGNEKAFTVSKHILCQTSDYFVKALDGNFKEANEKVLRLPGWNSDVVELFISWAYKPFLPDYRYLCEPTLENRTTLETSDTQKLLMRLWTFADAHLIPKLQDAAITKLVDVAAANAVDSEVVRFGYSTSAKGSKLRKFIIDQARYDYFVAEPPALLTAEKLASLAAIPGFLPEFLEPVREILDNGEDISSGTFGASWEIGASEYCGEAD